MNFRIYSIIAIFLLISAFAKAQEKVRFAYDVDYDTYFDNREYYKSDFSNSMTIFGNSLTPAVGIEIPVVERKANHRIMAGVDMLKDFGSQNNLGVFREVLLYYKFERQTSRSNIELYAGIFPRKAMSDRYSSAFFSDSLKFYDRNLEGLLVKIHKANADLEIGCDWMGQYSEQNRERFMLFFSGNYRLTDYLSAGYAGYMYHYACSGQADGVVDNLLFNPFVKFDFGEKLNLQELSLKAGYLQSFQHDRALVGHYVFPRGGECEISVRKWNVGIQAYSFYGTDMMPYYNSIDPGGFKYGTNLYFGEPFYRVHDDGKSNPSVYNRFSVSYSPYIGKCLNIRVEALFHFNAMSYSGCQQQVTINFNLDKLLRNS